MEIKDLKLLIKMITETDITEFEMDSDDEKIVIRRGQKPEVYHMSQPSPAFMQPPMQMAPIQQQSPQQQTPQQVPVPQESGEKITSPIVGTFYRAPSPDAAPFSEVGQIVEKGQVLCLVEAMKLFNEIEAEFKCKIVKICVENAQPVEFGQPLFIVEKL